MWTSFRTGRAIRFDPKRGEILEDKEAWALWGREYRKGWELQV